MAAINLALRNFNALWLSLIFAFASQAHADMTPEQVQSGALLISDADGTYHPALNLDTEASAQIHGMTAQVQLNQHFKNDSDQWREALYVFPLPEDAAIYRMEIHINERVIVGEVKEREDARKIYQQAKREGKIAALTEQERPNLFTQNVANIPPQATITVNLHYQHSVNYDMGAFSWRLPTTLTPRYIPGEPVNDDINDRFGDMEEEASSISSFGWSLPTTVVPDADRITPPMRPADQAPNITIYVDLNSGLPLSRVNSPYHPITIEENHGKHSIQLKESITPMDRDFVLEWLPQKGQSPTAGVFSEVIDGDYFASVMLIPPQVDQPTALTRDVVFVIDTSGSMAGLSIRQAKQSLLFALQRLNPGDRFNIIEFNSRHTTLFGKLRPANLLNVTRAKQWVGRLSADGGTEMLSALNEAIRNLGNDERLQQLVFITDGAIGNETQLFHRIERDIRATRLFTVGIGSAPNTYFMKKAAQFGRGSATYIGDLSEVASKMNELFMKLETAMVTDIQIDWGTDAEQYPVRIGDLYAGEPLLVTAKLNSPSAQIQVSGRTQNQSWKQSLQVEHTATQSGIARNWARSKIEFLEDKKIAGADPDEIRESVLALALQHQLISPYTSFVAVDKHISRTQNDPLNSQPITNSMPKGSLQAVPFSHTATPTALYLWLGVAFLLGFALLKRKGAAV